MAQDVSKVLQAELLANLRGAAASCDFGVNLTFAACVTERAAIKVCRADGADIRVPLINVGFPASLGQSTLGRVPPILGEGLWKQRGRLFHAGTAQG